MKVPLRFHNMVPDVYPHREGLVIRLADGKPEVEAMRWGFSTADLRLQQLRNERSQDEVSLLEALAESRASLPRAGRAVRRA